MTDHELCLAAAKAAGYTVEDARYLKRTTADGVTDYWFPLDNDGDAFRLMVDCFLDVSVFDGYTNAGEDRVTRTTEDHGTDKHAATRRAIVRAAAAMGVGE